MPDTSRDAQAEAFLATTAWAQATRRPLAGDASNRKYERLTMAGESAVLMDAAPEKGEDVRPFVAVARYLTTLGLAAPHIIAEDTANGFLLIEDLGDDLFARVVAVDNSTELAIYTAATDALIVLHNATPMPGLANYDVAVMTPLAGLAYDWYLGQTLGADPEKKAAFSADFDPILAKHSETTVTILRDYHAENLLWLPNRQGSARVGLLDFQDAMIGDPSYDLVSLLMDARRDVAPAVEAAMKAHYVAAQQLDPALFDAQYHVMGAQRNLRILGVFARLSCRDGKTHYVDLIPRVWAHLMRNLEHPALDPIAVRIRADLPAPTTDVLERLRR
ncbi:aminoglycoside phosphotransferase family protein [Pseudooceanicola sp.]|uniref:aminoglycoside phosphotransferase family protein n=1 Tax=Pseudooceanicola sp. TaxID=1914328 RepID=UPI00405A3352